MADLRCTGLALALGAAAAVVLPGVASAAQAVPVESAPATTQGTDRTDRTDRTDGTEGAGGAVGSGLSPASPLDLLLSTPGDVIGTLASGSPV